MIVGAGGPGMTVKFVALFAVPPGVVTVIGPVVAPAGEFAVICVVEFTVNAALVPLNATADTELKFVPVITTVVFCTPLAGVKLVIVGAGGACATSVVRRFVMFGTPTPVA